MPRATTASTAAGSVAPAQRSDGGRGIAEMRDGEGDVGVTREGHLPREALERR